MLGEDVELRRMSVHKNSRGLGLGGRLVEVVEEHARSIGAHAASSAVTVAACSTKSVADCTVHLTPMHLRRPGAKRVVLSTGSVMDLAMNLYEGCGYEVQRTMRFGLPGAELLGEEKQDSEGATFYQKVLNVANAAKL